MRLFILLLLFCCCLPAGHAAPPPADAATVQQLREDMIRQQERLDAARRDLDRQHQDQAEMEARVNASLADKEKGQEEAQKRQDDRISDIGQGVDRLGIYVALASVVITGLAVVLGVAGWFRIKSFAEKWEQEAAKNLKELETRQVTAVAQMEKRTQDHMDHMDQLRDQATTKSKTLTELLDRVTASAAGQGGVALSSVEQAELSAAAQEVDATPKSERSSADWLVLGNKALGDKEYGEALLHFDKALTHSSATNVERARALNGRGVALGRKNQHAAAAVAFDLAFQFASTCSLSDGHLLSVVSLFNKGVATDPSDSAAAIVIYRDVVRLFGDDSLPEIRQHVAKALVNMGVTLEETDRAAAIAIYDEVVRRFGNDSQPELRLAVARAQFNKSLDLADSDLAAATGQLEAILGEFGNDSTLKSLMDKVKMEIAKLRNKAS